jgi:hypothetical protein
MKRNIPYALIVPIAVVCFAVALMMWSMAGTSSGGGQQQTTGRGFATSNEPAVRVPTIPNNDTASDSARTPGTPLNKSR